jgi:hypothetical protein
MALIVAGTRHPLPAVVLSYFARRFLHNLQPALGGEVPEIQPLGLGLPRTPFLDCGRFADNLAPVSTAGQC